MKKQLSKAVREAAVPGLKRAAGRPLKFISGNPRADEWLARTAAGGYSDPRQGTEPPGYLRKKLSDLAIVSARGGEKKLAESVVQAGVETPGFLERMAQRVVGEDVQEAVRLRRRAVELDPDSVQRKVILADTLALDKRPGIARDQILGLTRSEVDVHGEEILSLLRGAIELTSGDPVLMFRLGRELFEQGYTSDGLRYMEAAVSKSPQGGWLRLLGDSYRRPHVARFDKALNAYERALDLDSKDSRALAGIVNIGVRATLDWQRIWRHAREIEKTRKSSPYSDEEVRSAVNKLFTSKADAASLRATAQGIRRYASRGKLLHPEVQRLIAIRALFLGSLSTGFGLHQSLAERKAQRLQKKSVRDVQTLKQLLQALAYTGEDELASGLSDPLFWKSSGEVSLRQVKKMHADVELLRGNISPLLEFSAELRRDTPLPGEDTMRELIKGKRVAIVGPADTGDELGEVIDGYDVIVRTNFNPEFVEANRAKQGSRTDIAYYGGKDLGERLDEIGRIVETTSLKLVVGRHFSFDALGNKDVPWLRFYRNEFPLYYNGFPLGVQRMSYDLLQFEPSEITLFNTDFYTGQFTAGYRDDKDTVFGPGSMLNDLLVQHDLFFDFRFMKALLSTGVVRGAGRAGEVLSLSPDEYIAALETKGLLGQASEEAQPSTPRQTENPEAQKHLDTAKGLLALHDEEEGIEDGQQHFRRALEAERELRAALEISPGDPALLWDLGKLLFERLNDSRQGLELMEAAVTKRPRGPWYRQLGDCYTQSHVARFDNALEAYEQAVSRNPKDQKAVARLVSIGPIGTRDWTRVWKMARRIELESPNSPLRAPAFKAALDDLFTRVPRRSEVYEMLQSLNKAAMLGKSLKPPVLDCVSLRLQTLGYLSTGHDLRVRVVNTKMGASITTPAALRERLSALVYLGRFQEAASLSNPYLWNPLNWEEAQTIKKLHADAQLLKGNAAPLLEYRASVSAAGRSPVFGTSMELIRGRRVAVVKEGDNSTGDHGDGSVEGYDVTIRVGAGRATLYHADRVLNWTLRDSDALSLYFYGHATSLAQCVYDLVQCSPAEIALFNPELYSPQEAHHDTDGADPLHALWSDTRWKELTAHYDLRTNFAILKQLHETGLLVVKGEAGRLLNLSSDEYTYLVESGSPGAREPEFAEEALDGRMSDQSDAMEGTGNE